MTGSIIANRPIEGAGKFDGIWGCYAYTLFFALIYLEWSFSALVAQQVSGLFRNVAMLLLLVPLLLRVDRVKVDKGCLVLFAAMSTLICFNYLRDGDIDNNILLAVTVLVGFVVSVFFSAREFSRVFGNVVVVLAAVSLPVFALSVLAPGVIDQLPLLASSYMDQQGVQVHDAFLAIGVTHSVTSRNCGIAWEPGAFSILLCTALYFTLLFPTKHKTAKTIILAITELTTLSTTGIVVMCAIFLLLFTGKSNVKKSVVGSVLIAALFIAGTMGLTDYALQILFSKLGGLFDISQPMAVTTQDRLNAALYPFEAFCEHPVFGVGYEQFIHINVNYCNSVAVNTILNWFALMGFLFGFPCAFFYLRAMTISLRKLRVNWVSATVAIIACLLVLMTEDMTRISLIYTFIFYGCSGFAKGFALFGFATKNTTSIAKDGDAL